MYHFNSRFFTYKPLSAQFKTAKRSIYMYLSPTSKGHISYDNRLHSVTRVHNVTFTSYVLTKQFKLVDMCIAATQRTFKKIKNL